MSLGGPEIGQTHYIVDSNYRTIAQGWYRADRTGPGDLHQERLQGYVFRTGDYTSDRACIQAATDAGIDFRGDVSFFTPGSYSIATTALAFDCVGMRYLGPEVRNPRRAAVTITDAIGDNAVSVDDCEFGFIRFVPLTAQNWFTISTGADGGWLHDFFYDAQGIAANTATEFVNASATTADWLVERGWHVVDALQGDCYTLATAVRWQFQDLYFLTEVASYATVFTLATNCVGNIARRCYFLGDADGTYTNLFTGAANENQQLMLDEIVVSGTALATASGIETGFGTTTDIEINRCWQTGDATLEGGVEIALA